MNEAQRHSDIKATVRHLDNSVVHLDKRVSVLEERTHAQGESIKQIHEDVKQNNSLITELADRIDRYRAEDAGNREKTHRWVIVTLAGVVAAIFVEIIKGMI